MKQSLTCAGISIPELAFLPAASILGSMPVCTCEIKVKKSEKECKICHGSGSISKSSKIWLDLATGIMEMGNVMSVSLILFLFCFVFFCFFSCVLHHGLGHLPSKVLQ